MCTKPSAAPQRLRGLTLVELVVFIVIISVGVVGILAVLDLNARRSADPLAPKQALAIAEALLEEVTQAPFTYCDPDDANFASASDAAGCATVPEGSGPEAGDARPYDNVNDYHGLTLAGIADASGITVPGLAAYSASISVVADRLGGGTAHPIDAGSGEALRITVTVQAPDGSAVTLEGYRARFAPNAGP